MKIKLSVLALLVLSLLNLTMQSCTNSSTTPRGVISVGVNGNGAGCTLVSYLDGGQPATMTSNGTFAVYPGISNATHAVSIYALSIGASGVCNITVDNNNHVVGVYNPCGGSAFSYTCN